jgi:type II secretory pathway component PulC
MQSYQWIYRISLTSIAATVFLGAGTLVHLFQSNNIRNYSPVSIKATWPKVAPDEFVFDASVFKKTSSDSSAIPQGSAAKRFRLAGTFFAVGLNQQARKAILDDLQKKEQLLVSEGDLIDDARVFSIMSDRIILRRGAIDEQIMLCFAGNSQSNNQLAAYSAGAGGKSLADMQNRFGKRVGDKRWVLMRSELMSYYKEVFNNTDRLAKVYDSLKPVYQGNNIAGYTLMVEGEGEMFTALGLQQGDVIRQVNSMPMTSQTRAEYFIGEFVKNRVNGFVLDIERSGRKEKLIYMIR